MKEEKERRESEEGKHTFANLRVNPLRARLHRLWVKRDHCRRTRRAITDKIHPPPDSHLEGEWYRRLPATGEHTRVRKALGHGFVHGTRRQEHGVQ